MGYGRGRSGLPVASRRAIWEDALNIELVATPAGAEAYVLEWGPLGRRRRLQKIVSPVLVKTEQVVQGCFLGVVATLL